ncbi:hypothetical protein V6N13_059724 [Hibiscus sabdariffa]
MMEVIRTKLMKNFVMKREEAEKWIAIQETNRNPESYVHECYNKSTQISIYSNIISPVKGPQQWVPVTDMEPILPPTIRRPPGRPTKKRKKEADEVVNPKLSKKGQQANCTKCGKTQQTDLQR